MAKRPKILVFIDWYLPAYKAGGQVMSVSNIVRLFQDDADIAIVTSDRDLGNDTAFSGVALNQWVAIDHARVIYLSPEQQTKARYRALIEELKPEVVYFNSLFSGKFTLVPLFALRKSGIRANVILAPRGMLGKGALNIKPVRKHLFLVFTRWLGLFKDIIWHASTPQEEAEINRHYGPHVNVAIAEDLARMPAIETNKHKTKTPGKLNIIFVSRVSPKKNLEFLIRSIAQSKHMHKIQLKVVGPKEEEKYFQICQTLANKLSVNVEFTGAIHPDQLPAEYTAADLFCLPTQHENYGHVIIEAMSYGLPVLLSKNTPWRELKQKNVGFDIDLDEALYSEHIDRFFDMNDYDYQTMSNAAKYFAHAVMNDPQKIQANRDLFLKVS